jgi:hypothetical protein
MKTEVQLSECSEFHPFNIAEMFPFFPHILFICFAHLSDHTAANIPEWTKLFEFVQESILFHKLENVNTIKINLVLNLLNYNETVKYTKN